MSRTGATLVAGVERGFYLPNKVPLFCGSSSILSSEQQLPPLCKSLVYIAKRKVKATIGTVPLSPMHEKRGEPGIAEEETDYCNPTPSKLNIK